MAKTRYYVKALNRVLDFGIDKDTFDFDEIYKAFKDAYPRCVPSRGRVRTLLKHSKVRATQENGHYIKVK